MAFRPLTRQVTQCRCGNEYFMRVRRRWWQRLLFPHSKAFRCDACHRRYLVSNHAKSTNKTHPRLPVG